MTDQSASPLPKIDEGKLSTSDTLPVPPPSFRERLEAAQRARANEVRPSVTIPLPNRQTQIDDVVSMEEAPQIAESEKSDQP
jgi:hypothetical protein